MGAEYIERPTERLDGKRVRPRFLSLLMGRLPSQCHICRGWQDKPLCAACRVRFRPCGERCPACAQPLMTGHCACAGQGPAHLDACVAAVDYAWPWNELIGRFKYAAEAGLAHVLADVMQRSAPVRQALEVATVVIPVPLADARLRERGFSPPLELARALGLGTIDAISLRRVRETQSQSRLSRAEREQNLRGAFAVDPLRAARLAGADAVLLDDVATTGATLSQAAWALRAAGVRRVTGVVFARAVLQEA